MERAHLDTFRQLHAGNEILLLANAWDAGSARLIESLGARACATSSAGVAWSLGYPDGDAAPVAEVIAAVGRIARTVTTPLSVDIEGGYSTELAQVEGLVRALLDLGVVGVNIEDGGADPDLLAAKIEAIKRTVRSSGADLFVNARTDVYLRSRDAGEGLLANAVARASRYRAAGADGIFVPGMTDLAAMRTLTQEVPLPLNIMAVAGLASRSDLATAGVRRLSAGAAISKRAFALVEGLSRDFLATGSSDPLLANAMDYGQLQQLFTPG